MHVCGGNGLRAPDDSEWFVDADQVARGIAEGAVANSIRLCGRLLDDLGVAGLQPLDKVEGEITNKLYTQKMQPSLRGYLAQLREESYVMLKPGYTDSAAVSGATVIQEVAPTPDAPKKKKKLPLPKASRS